MCHKAQTICFEMNRIHFNIKRNLSVVLAGMLFLSLSAHAQNGKRKPKSFPVPDNIPDTNKVGFPVMPNATNPGNGSDQYMTLKQCIDYAMIHQPALNK